jgi:hypothetical protein
MPPDGKSVDQVTSSTGITENAGQTMLSAILPATSNATLFTLTGMSKQRSLNYIILRVNSRKERPLMTVHLIGIADERALIQKLVVSHILQSTNNDRAL